MKINLYNLQKEVIEDYNSLVQLLKEAQKDEASGFITLDGYELGKKMRYLHNDLVLFGLIIEKEGGTPYLNGEKVKIDSFHFDDEE